ncbi:MAG: ribosome recycling factor [Alphaproteobacteria bacterium]|jgi:ribosome recycling factor|nr:ribosome recycling factor [Alphaproteobacteria bacterium]MBT4711597.1 ribosome recycling factor [Alphaproteobacteria bacterium]
MASFDLEDLRRRMDGALEDLHKEFTGLRTGRAAISLLEPIIVEAYGAEMPMPQVGTVSAPEPRMLSVQVWDKGLVLSVEKAIRNANLGLNPIVDGQLVRVPIPELTEDRRKDMVKIAHKFSEEHRVAVRNVRRDGMDKLKADEKGGEISEDKHRELADAVQKLTDEKVGAVDEALAVKEQEIMQV